MKYLKQRIKYELIRNRIKKQNPFVCDKHPEYPTIYLFFVACGTNMGDHAIVQAEMEFIKKYCNKSIKIVPITVSQTESAISWLRENIQSSDIIILSGGGYIGDEYIEVYVPLLKIFKLFSKQKIIILPQTIFFKSVAHEREFIRLCKKCNDLSIFAREQVSANIFSQYKITCFLTPDIVLSRVPQIHQEREKILLCLRDDVEKAITREDAYLMREVAEKYGSVEEQDTVLKESFPIEERELYLKMILDVFLNASFVITDRIHGMIFCYLTNTPCLVVGNYNHKVESEYVWLKDCAKIQFIHTITQETIECAINEICQNTENDNRGFDLEYEELKKVLENI